MVGQPVIEVELPRARPFVEDVVTRSNLMGPIFALLLAVLLLVTFYLFAEVRRLQREVESLAGSTALSQRLDAVEAQAAQTESRLAGLLLAAGVGVEEVASQLESVSQEEITLTVPINESIPIDLEIPFTTRIEVPVRSDIPVQTTVDIPIDLGIFGENTISVPINTIIPVDLIVPVTLDTEVPIDTTLPIELEVPVTLTLADSPLGAQLDAWQEALRGLATQLAPAELTD